MQGANVRLDAFSDHEAGGVTGGDGSFTIPIRRQVVDGTSLIARSAGGDRIGIFQFDFNLTGAEAEKLARIVLKPAREVIVLVTDSSTAAVPGAVVEAAGIRAVLDDAMTGSDGSVKLHVPADSEVQWIIALKSGRGFDYAEYGTIDEARRSQRGSPVAEIPMSVTLTLDGAKTAHIMAVDRSDKPLAGVGFRPWLLHKDGRRSNVNFSSRIFAAITGPDGVATFDWLPVSKDDLIFWPASESYAHRRVLLKEDENRTVIAKLTRTEAIRGHVVGPDGSPAAGIKVRAFGSGQGLDHGQRQVRTAVDGSYELNVNAREAYAVFVDEEGSCGPRPTRPSTLVVREGQLGRRSRFQAHAWDHHPWDSHHRRRRSARAQSVHPARRNGGPTSGRPA